ncbi:MAG: discoidin domain-containing protein [Pirellulales bacterium]
MTLAEVEVFDGDRNIARAGKAKQTNTDFGGDASCAIDGKTDGAYGAGTSTHTQEQTPGAFWEVDLGSERPIDRIAIHGRTDGEFYKRLQGFTVSILDANRNEVWKAANNPAPRVGAEFKPSGETSIRALRHAAFQALTAVRGKESEVFATLAEWTKQPADRAAAIRAATLAAQHVVPRTGRTADLRTADRPAQDVAVGTSGRRRVERAGIRRRVGRVAAGRRSRGRFAPCSTNWACEW